MSYFSVVLCSFSNFLIEIIVDIVSFFEHAIFALLMVISCHIDFFLNYIYLFPGAAVTNNPKLGGWQQ